MGLTILYELILLLLRGKCGARYATCKMPIDSIKSEGHLREVSHHRDGIFIARTHFDLQKHNDSLGND